MKAGTATIVSVGTLALAGAVLAGPSTQASHLSSSADRTSRFIGPPRELAHFGHVRSLVRTDGRFELRFDPAFWLGGLTARLAAVEDKVIAPGEPVPNDYYVRDEGRRLLTYRVPPNARVTVLTNAGGIRSTRVTVSELAQIVKGKNPKRRSLYDRQNGLGYWIRVVGDTVRSLDQQYQP